MKDISLDPSNEIKENNRPVTRQELVDWGKKMDKKLSKMIDDALLPFFKKI